jgi:hypothetical protein
MGDTTKILNATQMRERYGSFYHSGSKLQLDRGRIPEQFWPLIPYAEHWGASDDWTREDLIESAPVEVLQNLKHVVAEFDNAMNEWLAGPEADDRPPSEEYVAYTAMRMAADYV